VDLNHCHSQYYRPRPTQSSTSGPTTAANVPLAANSASIASSSASITLSHPASTSASQLRPSGVVEPQSSLSQALHINTEAPRKVPSAVPPSAGTLLGSSGDSATNSDSQSVSNTVQTLDMAKRGLGIAGRQWASEAPINGILLLPPPLGCLWKNGPKPTDVVHITDEPPSPSSYPNLIFFSFQQQADKSFKVVRRASQPSGTISPAQPSTSYVTQKNEQKTVRYSGPHVQTTPAHVAVPVAKLNPQSSVKTPTNPPMTAMTPVTPIRLQQPGVKPRTPSEADKKRLAKDVIRALGFSSRDGKRKRADDEAVFGSEKEGHTKRRSVEPDALPLMHEEEGEFQSNRPVSVPESARRPVAVAPQPFSVAAADVSDTRLSSRPSPNTSSPNEPSTSTLPDPPPQLREQTVPTTTFSVNETDPRGAGTDSSDDGIIEESILPRTHSPSSRLYTPPPATPTLTTPPPATPPPDISLPTDITPRPRKVPLFLPSLSSSPSVPSLHEEQHISDDENEGVDAEIANELPDTPQRLTARIKSASTSSLLPQSRPTRNRQAYVLVPPLPSWAKSGNVSHKVEGKAGKEKEVDEEDLSDEGSDHHEWTEAEGQSTFSDKL
jgi:hypothetical protein